MRKQFVLDSNILFSAMLNINSPIGKFIMASSVDDVTFYAPEYLSIEVERHLPKIMQLSEMTEVELRRLLAILYEKIEFVPDAIIPFKYYALSVPLVSDVDMDDIVFVALTEYLNAALLWTGDKKLYKALESKGYHKIVTFERIKEMFGIE